MLRKKIVDTFSIFLILLAISCSDNNIETDPYIVITFPTENTEIFEEITIVCSTNIENGEIFDFYLKNSNGELLDKIGNNTSNPRSIIFNTTDDLNNDGQPDLSDGIYFIEVFNENSKTGDTVSVNLNNNLASPNPVDILSITSTSPDGYVGRYEIIWNKSQDQDFAKYYLEYSDNLENFDSNYQTIYEIENPDSNSFTFITGSLLENRYFRVKVVDKFNLISKGQIFSSEAKIQPELLTIVSLTYDTSNFYITWNKSNDLEFSFYEIKCSSPQENGADAHQVLEEIYDISDTTISVSGFSPVRENYFFVRQVNNSGVRPGWHIDDWVERRNPSTNLTRSQTILIDSLYVPVIDFDCDANPITFFWEESQDPFFSFYELAWRDGITNGEKIILDTLYNKSITHSNIIYYDSNVAWNQYYVHVFDFWGTKADGNQFGRLEQFCD